MLNLANNFVMRSMTPLSPPASRGSGGALFRQVRRGDHIQTGRLSSRSARRQITYRAELAGVEGVISGYSLRVGSAVSLAQAGASVVDMQVAGRWKSPQMPAHYAKTQLAERGAIARFKEKKRVEKKQKRLDSVLSIVYNGV